MSLEVDQVAEIAEAQHPLHFFETVHEAFLEARSSTVHSEERFYRVAEHTFRLQFGGRALVPLLTPALEHLRVEASGPVDWTICLWDEASTGVNLPPPPWRGDAYRPRGEIRGFSDQRIRTAYHIGAGALSMLDASRRLGIYAAQDASHIPSDEIGSPLRTILHWALHDHQLQFIHAGAVGYPEGGVLLAGWGGAGKSTTALACLRSDLSHVSDDYSLLSTESYPYIYSLYNSAKLNLDSIEKLSFLRSAISNPDRLDMQKAIFFLQDHYPQKLIKGFPVHAIFLPRVTGNRDVTLSRATPITCLRSLALSTMRQLAGAGTGTMRIISRLMKQTPCFYLNLGGDVEQIPRVISNFLKGRL